MHNNLVAYVCIPFCDRKCGSVQKQPIIMLNTRFS